MKVHKTQFHKGLAFGPPADILEDGYTLRNRGLHSLARGSFRSRPGSSVLHSLNAHSIVYFADKYHYGVGTSLYRASSSIKSSLSGSRLSFAKMPPTAGVVDYLFCAGGDDLFKVDSSGNVTDWGFAEPASDPSATAAAGGSLADADWGYQITYYNSTTGHRSDANGTTVTATTSGADNSVALTSIPDPTGIDTQISHVEIWRTVADGTALFYLARVAAGTTSYTDDGSVTLSATELPTDNLQPDADATDCLGPHNASMFWLYGDSGTRGRVYYSPIGRPESVSGYINVTSNDRPLLKLFLYQGQLGVIGEDGIYIIAGTNPYLARKVPGCPGTSIKNSVSIDPVNGVFYQASDGIRVFNSIISQLADPGSIERLIRGNSLNGLTSFTGVVSTFGRDEYIISDTSQTLAFSTTEKRWRDIGVGCNALYYNDETSELAATISSTVLSLEEEGQTDDNGTDISISIEPGYVSFDDDRDRILQHLTFDIDCNSESITVTLIHDDTETSVATLSTSSRVRRTIAIGITGQVFGVRLTGSISSAIELYKITFHFNDLNVEVETK